jgi:hypothetical protein
VLTKSEQLVAFASELWDASRRDVMVPSASFASRAIDIDLAQQIKE